ncbi:MAG: threonine synthase [Treponema sp.]|nr:threonine synthase [Treponema sp.]
MNEKTYAHSLICDDCKKDFPLDGHFTLCPCCGGLLEVQYQLNAMKKDLSRLFQDSRDRSIWRYRDFFPFVEEKNIVSLGEGGTPLIQSNHIGKEFGVPELYFKNDTMMPTGSFKDRGFSLAISYARQIGVKNAFTYSSGNAGASFAAYSARSGFPALVCVEYIASDTKKEMIQLYGANTAILYYDSFEEIAQMLKSAAQELKIYQFVNFINPIRHEAMKTYAYEIFESMSKAPDIMIHPVGTGGGLYGAYKGFKELAELGFIDSIPRFFAVQPLDCSHYKQAFDKGEKEAGRYGETDKTIAQSIASDAPLHKGRRVLDAIYDSNGAALAVTDEEILEAMRELAREGIAAEPSAAASLAGFKNGVNRGLIKSGDTVVCVITGGALKQPAAVKMAAKLSEHKLKANITELKRILDLQVSKQ